MISRDIFVAARAVPATEPSVLRAVIRRLTAPPTQTMLRSQSLPRALSMITRRVAGCSFLLLWLATHEGAAQRPGAASPAGAASLLIRNVTLIDGTGLPARSGVDIVVRGERIERVSTATESHPATDTITGRDLFVIPGLIDGHVHLGTRPREREVEQLERALRGGVTAVIDMASDVRVTGQLAADVRTGRVAGPAIYFTALLAGPPFFTDPRARAASRGYAPGSAPWQRAITGDAEIAAAVAEAKATGAAAIKLYAALDGPLASRVVAEARRQALAVFAHATLFPAKPGELVRAGADLLAHTPYLVWEGSPPTSEFERRARGDFLGVPASDSTIERLLLAMRSQRVALNPTLWVFAEGVPEDSVSRVRAPWMFAVTRRAAALEVPIVAGTDGLFGRGGGDGLPQIHRELELLVTRAGLTPLQAIAAATGNAAAVVGAGHERGTVQPGRVADLLVLDANPLSDIRNTRRIRHVVRNGEIVPRR